MKVVGRICLPIWFCFFCSVGDSSNDPWFDVLRPRRIESYFSFPGRYVPESAKRNVRNEILELIRGARFSVDLWIYSFDDPEILQELKNASQRGVNISIVADPEKDYPLGLNSLGLFRRWERSGLQHSKILIIDRRRVFLGSGNFTWYGLENDWNGYVEFDLFDREVEDFYSFLEEDPRFVSLDISPFQFFNSPSKGRTIQNLLLREADLASESIRYLIFDHYDSVFSSRLSLADRRGVKVRGVYDYPVDDEGIFLSKNFLNSGSRIFADGNEERVDTDSFGKGGLLHHKSILFDGRVLLSGSFNFSISARDQNRELLFRTKDPYLLETFGNEFERIRRASIPHTRDESGGSSSENGSVWFFRYPDDTIPSGSEQFLCRDKSSEEETSFLESGSFFLKSILEYRFKIGESCKPLSSFYASSSGYTGKKTNHPVKSSSFRKKSYLRGKTGEVLIEPDVSDEQELGPVFEKPVYLFLPDFFSIVSGLVRFPEGNDEIGPVRKVFSYYRGTLDEISWSQGSSSFRIFPALSDAMIFFEGDSYVSAFCFHSADRVGAEWNELIDEMISYRKSTFTVEGNGTVLDFKKVELEKRALEERSRSKTSCFRY
ncbi:phospholipase D-like domain-containing protein [Leptospira gomenensis]|nr:phospholipase D-like domain-containing protein [Leptospira gomenensis]